MKIKLRYNVINNIEEELINDIKRVTGFLNKKNITQNEYIKLGKFSHYLFYKLFGSWNNALKKAGLDITVSKTITNEQLLDNLDKVWKKLGHQPRHKEIKKPFSDYSVDIYCKRFKGWRNALKKFIEYKQGNVSSKSDEKQINSERS